VGKDRKRPSLQRSESGSRRKTHTTKHGNSITKNLCMRTMVHNSAEIGTYMPPACRSSRSRLARTALRHACSALNKLLGPSGFFYD
jgi:hypothetical protein